MGNKKLEKELNEANQSLQRGMFVRLGYTFLIKELIKQHPNPEAVFNNIIKDYPQFKPYIIDLADLLELDLGICK